jgi:hypothetical protein
MTFDCLQKPLSHIAMLTGITITLLHKLLKPYQLIDHSRIVPANSQSSNKDLFGIISLMVSTISKHSPQHQYCSSLEVRNFTNNLS